MIFYCNFSGVVFLGRKMKWQTERLRHFLSFTTTPSICFWCWDSSTSSTPSTHSCILRTCPLSPPSLPPSLPLSFSPSPSLSLSVWQFIFLDSLSVTTLVRWLVLVWSWRFSPLESDRFTKIREFDCYRTFFAHEYILLCTVHV